MMADSALMELRQMLRTAHDLKSVQGSGTWLTGLGNSATSKVLTLEQAW